MTDAQFVDAHVALGLSVQGGLDPLDLDPPNPLTDLWYARIPETYRVADAQDTTTAAGYPLWGFLDALASTLDEPLRLADRIGAGDLTNPGVAPDEWIPWLAQAAGSTAVGITAQRQQLSNMGASPPGSRRYLEVVAQQFLTGTRFAQVTPAEPWGIQIRVRSDELSLVGNTLQGLADAMYASGEVPAGFLLQVVSDQQTWGQIQLAVQDWADGEGKTWARMQSIGLAGSGQVTGGVRWTGSAVGVRP